MPTTVVQVDTTNKISDKIGMTTKILIDRSTNCSAVATGPFPSPRNQSRWRTSSAPPIQTAIPRKKTKTPKAGGKMSLRKKSAVSCEVISENPIADDTAEKNAEVVATTMNSRLNSDEPERRDEGRIATVSPPSSASTIADRSE